LWSKISLQTTYLWDSEVSRIL